MTEEKGRHVKRDEIAFSGEHLGAAKTQIEGLGFKLRTLFDALLRGVEQLAGHGIAIQPAQITFDDVIVQAAWEAFLHERGGVGEERKSISAVPPVMATEDELVDGVVHAASF